jgi:peptide/nickel transport system substrate-binding protein
VDDAMSRSAVALAVSGVAALVVCTGCSRVENGTQPSGQNAVPGVVRIVGIGSIDSLIPQLAGNASGADIAMFWGAWLFRVDDRGGLVPELATQIPTQRNGGISADGLTITYHLRAGVRWQDGVPFGADDVIFSWHAMMNPANDVLTRIGFDQIASMSAPDPLTVIVRLKRPYAPAISAFFGPDLAPACILPAHILARLPDINRAAYDTHPIGTGPYILTRYDYGNRVVLRANPSYWRGAPKLKEVDFLIVPDPNTRALMMRTGEADLYYMPADDLVASLQAIPGVKTIDNTFDEFWYLGLNAQHAPLDDVRVRRAISMSVDRDYVIRTMAGGLGTPANGDQPSYSWAFDPDVRAPAFDPAAAGRLLDEAGWQLRPDGHRYRAGKKLSITYITSSGYGEATRFGPVFQVEMKRIGIEAEVKTYPTSVLYAAKANGGIVDNGKYDVAWLGWIGGVDPDDDTLWACDQFPPDGYNLSFYCDPRIDAQERIALSSYDLPTRRAAYRRIQELLDEDVPVDFLFWTHSHDAMRAGLTDYRPGPTVTEFTNPWQWQI